jgi:hypothetical protein
MITHLRLRNLPLTRLGKTGSRAAYRLGWESANGNHSIGMEKLNLFFQLAPQPALTCIKS